MAKQVPPPAVSRGMNAKLALAQHRGAIGKANNNLGATYECQVNQRERFANPESVR